MPQAQYWGALGLFGTRAGALGDSDLLVARTLAHVACVALLQEHHPTPATLVPPLRAALTGRVVVDQATGFVSERLGVPTEEAFRLLRRYAHTHETHLTDAARHVVARSDERENILAALTEMTAAE